jgi:cation diffusion facilitator family transporter
VKVLVAGATGALGVPTVRALVARGYEVIGVTRFRSNRRRLEDLGAAPMVADALDAEAIRRAVAAAAPEAVMDLLSALPRGGPGHPSDMEPTNRLRTEGTRNLLDAAIAAGVRRYVAESHFLVYGSGNLGETPLTEDLVTPVRAPAQTLQETVEALATRERTVLGATRAGQIEGVVLRFGDPYGVGAGTEEIAGILRGRRQRLPVADSSGLGTPWVHVDEAAEAIVAALERGSAGAVYNVAEDEPISFAEFVRGLAAAVAAPPPFSVPGPVMAWVAPYIKAARVDTSVVLSNERARAELGWSPRFPGPREGLVQVGSEITASSAMAAAPSTTTGTGESLRTVIVALSTNVVMVLAKAAAAAVTGSPALFAETLHSLADTGNEVLLFTAAWSARKPADLRHPFGYGAEVYFWSLLAALGIFLTGGALSIWEGLQQLLHPHPAANFAFGYAVLGVGFLIDGTSWVASLRQLRREARARGVPLGQHVRSTTDTMVTAVYLEDGAALLGGLLALVGLALHQVTGSAIPDALAAIAIGLLLAAIGVRLIRRNRALLTNLSESPAVLDRIRDLLKAHPDVERVGSIASLYVGPHQLLVTAEIQPVDELSGLRVRELAEELRGLVKAAVPRVTIVYMTPVVEAQGQVLTPFDPDYFMRRHPDPEQS